MSKLSVASSILICLFAFGFQNSLKQKSVALPTKQTSQNTTSVSSASDSMRNIKNTNIQRVIIDSIRWSPNFQIMSKPQAIYKTLIDILSALLTPLIAIIATYIAYQQYRTNKLQLQNELYERRLEIYRALRQFIGLAVQYGGVPNEELPKFLRGTSESYFLFGDDVAKYLNEVYLKGVDYNYVYNRLHPDSSSINQKELEQLANKGEELIKWFSAQFEISEKLFGTYMRIAE